MIQQTPGRRYDHVHATPERMLLRRHSDTAEDRRARYRCVDCDLVEMLRDLRSELPGRRDNQRTRRPAWPLDQLVKDRKKKGRRFAAASRRARKHVAPFHGGRYGVELDWSRANEAQFLESFQKIGVELETAK